MSFAFDVMARAFADKIEPHIDPDLAYRFSRLIEEMHDANHEVKDAINHNPRVTRAAQKLDNLVAAQTKAAQKAAEAAAQEAAAPAVAAPWCVHETTRPDAGGVLLVPARVVNNEFVEADITPTYDREAVQRWCAQHNAAAE